MPTTTYLILKKIYKAEFVQSRQIRSLKSTLTTPLHIDMVLIVNEVKSDTGFFGKS